ncbi:MAG: rod shape-determining protein MreC [Bdellovibrionales bacterium]|nr:rod shape-determining protein MreC [Bdellovibrionales bacterium]
MLKLIKQYRFYLILLLFLLIPLLSIDTVNRSPRDYRTYDRIALAVTTPFEIAIHWTLDSIFGIYKNYLSLWNTRRENIALIDENRKLVNTILNLRELEQENIRFRDLLQFKETYKVNTVLARIIAKDVSSEFRTLRINRGHESGIEPNMAVINSEGVVGRILRVSENTADVVSILDPLSAIDSYILRSRVRGIVEGLTDTLCQLKFALRVDDIQPGDILLSSGLGGNFPKGVPVGTVIKVTRKSYGITQKVEVKPGVDFSKVEEVLVVTHADSAPVHSQLVEPAQKSIQKNAPGKP